jgi:hypothetical protein
MTDEDDSTTDSTTFTYKQETREFLEETYPDALGLSEAIRNAISDARLLREGSGSDPREEESDRE